ncbi:peptidylprolyl isomerase [Sinimarinibacterium flocculans]|uniref:peptidylprolyl isomerase n=1 Tax=Sinimarinibacterium flocculans TaxID=985250 RepID=UPI003C706D3C
MAYRTVFFAPRFLITGFAALGLSTLAGCQSLGARAAVEAADPAVISESENARLTLADYRANFIEMKAEQADRLLGSREALLDNVLDFHSNSDLAAQAAELGLDKAPVVAAQLSRARRMILVAAMLGRVSRQIEVPDDLEVLAKERYLQQQDKWVTHERRKVAHILVTPGTGCRCEVPQPAETIRKIQERLAKGESFAALAKEYSDDPSTAGAGGEISSWLLRDGKTVPQFENAAFALKEVGDVSGPVETAYGIHLIKLTELEPSRQLSFDEVKPAIEEQIRQQLRFSAMEQARGDAYPRDEAIDLDAIQNLLREMRASMPESEPAEPPAP